MRPVMRLVAVGAIALLSCGAVQAQSEGPEDSPEGRLCWLVANHIPECDDWGTEINRSDFGGTGTGTGVTSGDGGGTGGTGSTGGNGDEAVSVPEPGSMALLLTMLVALAGLRRLA